MFRIEIETAEGECRLFGEPWREGGLYFDSAEDADVRAESLWFHAMHECPDLYARFSVIDQDENTISDWEL